MASNGRERDAARKRAKAMVARLVEIPRIGKANRQRRRRLEKNDLAWLRYYFADIFTDDFTDQHEEMIGAIFHAARRGGDQALAASRGGAKRRSRSAVSSSWS